MAEPAPINPNAHSDRHNALADMRFASVVDDSDLTPSEDDATPDEQELELETVTSAIGVSIGHQQTRLTSPKTPAAEKAAALDATEDGGLFDAWQQPTEGPIEQSLPRPIPSSNPTQSSDIETPTQKARGETPPHEPAVRLPSPWRAEPKTFQRVDDHRAVLRDSLQAQSRRRAMSGSSAADALRKYMPFSMSKSSSFLSFSLPSFSVPSFDNTRGRQSPLNGYQRRRVTSMHDNSLRSGGLAQHDGTYHSKGDSHRRRSRSSSRLQPRQPTTEPIPQRQFEVSGQAPNPAAPQRPSQNLAREPTLGLRRSNSEGSLLLYRSKSWASSLGDDSRFEHVSEQVNSRLKAIKDSWQDSNFKLPSMPTMPNFSFGSRDDFFRSNRSGQATPRGFNSDAMHNHRSSFLAGSNSQSRSTSVKPPRTKGSSADLAPGAAVTHPFFNKALQDLTGDVLVLGGYRGSILRSAEAPHRQLWVPIKVGLNLRKVDLELGLNPEDEETEEQRIIPDGMLTHIGPVDIAKRLFKRLKASDNAKSGSLRVHNYGYDWRLSPHILSRRLIAYLKSLPCNQPGVPPEKRGAIIIAHSLGGLLIRHAINQHPELVAGVVYAGVPQNCINILGPLRNGDDVLLSSRVLTAQVNFTIRTSYALLPLDGKCFINKHTKEEYPLDFFDIKTWTDHSLSPVLGNVLPVENPSTASNLSISNLLNSMSQALPSLPGRKSSVSRGSSTNNLNGLSPSTNGDIQSTPSHGGAVREVAHNAANKVTEGSSAAAGVTPQMNSTHKGLNGQEYSTSQTNPATAVTLPFDKAHAYLTRTLAEMKAFKQALDYLPELGESNRYPPIALIYGKSTPTVYGAKVESKEMIKTVKAYDELAFASGDGVVLAKAAMVPKGYSVVRGGIVNSDRGHVTLLGDLEAVGRCLNAVMGARMAGVGLGSKVLVGKGKVEA
jgi:hypothetical protein